MTATTPQTGYETLPNLLMRNVARHPDKPAYREKEFGIWQSWTWAQAAHEIESFACGLADLGLGVGDSVAIIGRNRPAMYWAMIAVQMCGAIPVPLYQDAVAEEMVYVLDNSHARFVIAGDQEQIDKIHEVQDQIPRVEKMIYHDPRGMRKYDADNLFSMAEIQRTGREKHADIWPRLQGVQASQGYDDTCVMLYTSGTTGRPKGVVLSNRNIIETSKNSAEFDHLRADEDILAYLPMAWVGDFIFSVGQALWTGFCVNCPESADTMQMDLREIGPHHYMDLAKKVGPQLLDGESVGFGDRLGYFLGNLFVYGPLKNTLGLSRVRVGYTAGEAIGPELFAFYRSLGINLKQLYGQTEASVFITQQPDGQVRSDTVGVPSPGVELKISDSGEVFYRSPGVFVEYFNNPDSTASTKDADGWVATGDAGFIDPESGHLRIIDRAKDVGKMSDGAMFAPKYVENKLKFFPNILEAVVFGNGRDMCTAFLNIDLTAVGNWAERNNIAYSSYQELTGHARVLEILRGHVDEVNKSVAADPMLAGCQVHRFVVLHKQLDPDDGEMTRTQKVRRIVVEDKFSDVIDAMYGGKADVYTETEVTYEDGRKGKIKATLTIVDAAVQPVQHLEAAE